MAASEIPDDLPGIEVIIKDMTEMLLDFDIENDFWDYPPVLYLIGTPQPDHPGKYRVHMMDASNLFNIDAPPPQILMTIGKALGMKEAPAPPVDFEDGERCIGVIFRHEGWGLSSGKGISKEEMEEWMAQGKRFVDHPAAIESKIVAGYTRLGGGIAWMQERNGEKRFHDSFEGRVMDALEEVLSGAEKRWG